MESGAIWYLHRINLKKGKNCWHVGGACTRRARHATPSIGRTLHVEVALDVSHHPLHSEARSSIPYTLEFR
jgi:hypothetical protein